MQRPRPLSIDITDNADYLEQSYMTNGTEISNNQYEFIEIIFFILFDI